VPLTPLRAKCGTGVAEAVEVIDGHWVMVGDPRATFFRDLARGGCNRRNLADEQLPTMRVGLGFFKELSGPRLAPSRDVCV
jgi:hypothetical protein